MSYSTKYLIGKTVHCISHHSDCERVCLEKIFAEKPHLNLRQVVNQHVITFLREGKNVVVDDCNSKLTKRMSYVNLVLKKLAEVRVECQILKPVGGLEHLLWSREVIIAESLSLLQEQTRNWARVDTIIRNWKEDAEKPTPEDSLFVVEVTTQIVLQTPYKFEVAAIFIQWEAVYKESEDGEIQLVKGLPEAIQQWYKCNMCGRIIIIHEGVSTPGVSSSEKESQIRYVLKELSSKLAECPVYLFYLSQPSDAGGYCIPPQPGILAFLHRFHSINLHGKTTMYWYHSVNHMKMAEKAGVKHIKASRVFAHPRMASSSQATVRPSIPHMLETCRVIPPLDGWSDLYSTHPTIPLYKISHTTKSGIVCKVMSEVGRNLFLAYSDQGMLDRYHKLYCDNATDIKSTEDSKIEQAILSQASFTSQRETVSMSVSMQGDSRGLPSWMIPKKSKSRGQSTAVDDEPVKKKANKLAGLKSVGSSTIYVLSDEELVEFGKQVLTQAGEKVPTQEEVELYLSQNESMLSKSQPLRNSSETSTKKKRTNVNKGVKSKSDADQDSRKSIKKKKYDEESMVTETVSAKKKPWSHDHSQETLDELDELFAEDEEVPKKAAPKTKRATIQDRDLEEMLGNPYSTSQSTTHTRAEAHKENTASSNNNKEGSFVAESQLQSISKPSPVFHGKIADASEAQFDMFLSSFLDKEDDDDNVYYNPANRKLNTVGTKPADDTVIIKSSLVEESPSTKSSSHSSKGSVRTIALSLVKETSTESSRTRSSKESNFTIPESLVKDSTSFSSKGTRSSRESNVTIPESLVKDSSSFSSKGTRGSKECIDDSYVKESSSIQNSNSKSTNVSIDIIPNSLVSNTTSGSSKSSINSKHSITIPDSYIKNTSSSSFSSGRRDRSSGDFTVPDSFVPNTITTIPESSSLSSEEKKLVSDSNSSGRERSTTYKRTPAAADLKRDPFLDDFL